MIFSRTGRSIFIFLRKVEIVGAKCFGNVVPSSINVSLSEEANTEPEITDKSLVKNINKGIPLTIDDFKYLKGLKPCQPEDPHLLKVAILGEPNVGKSTLTNNLAKWKVCAVSRKVHTTRRRAVAVLVEQNKQIVFLDTPGLVTPELTKKHSLEASFVMDPLKSIREANLIAVVVDISNKWTNNRIHENVLNVLQNFKDKKSILILNKVDAMKSKKRILSLTRILTGGIIDGVECTNFDLKLNDEGMSKEDIVQLVSETLKTDLEKNTSINVSHSKESDRGWTLFSRVFMVSALKNDGMDALREYLLSEALPMNWMYHEGTVTDQHPHEIALMTVRAKLLEYLPEEIPYVLDLRITKWELLSTGCPKIVIKIICPNSRHRRFVIGPGGKHIAACVEKSRKAMREAFRKDVVLNIAVE